MCRALTPGPIRLKEIIIYVHSANLETKLTTKKMSYDRWQLVGIETAGMQPTIIMICLTELTRNIKWDYLES